MITITIENGDLGTVLINNTTTVPCIEAIKIGRQVMYMYESFLL